MKAEFLKDQNKLLVIPETTEEITILKTFIGIVKTFEHFKGLVLEKITNKG